MNEKTVRIMADADGKPVIQVRIPSKRWYKTEWQRCRSFLLDLLSTGPLPSTQAKEAAILAGFSPSVVRQTKERIGLVSEYHGTVGSPGHWWWRMPDEREPLYQRQAAGVEDDVAVDDMD